MKHYFLHSHLDIVAKKKIEAVSDEDVESFHEDMSRMETKYTRQWGPNVLADSCWQQQLVNIRGKRREVSV